jgi:hypothetical protein
MRTLFVCGVVLMLAIPLVAAPDTNKPGPIDDSAKIAEKLLDRIDFDQGGESIPLKEVLQYLRDKCGLNILFDTKSLRETGEGVPSSVDDATISIPNMKNVRIETVMRKIVDQIDLEFVITSDHVSITTAATKDLLTGQAKRLPDLYPANGNEDQFAEVERSIQVRTTPFITASFKDVSAAEAFKEVASRAGRTVVISQAASEKAKSSLTVHLTNVAFETATASLAEAAGLRAFRTGNVVVIVTTERAKQIDEQHARLNPAFLGPMVGFAETGTTESKVKELEEKIKKLTEELEKAKK